MRQKILRGLQHSDMFALLAVSAATGVFILGHQYFAKEQWAIFYLLVIVLVASVRGTRAAVVAAVLSFIAWDYFFLFPFQNLSLLDQKDWVALIGFLVVGIVIGVQTGRMREREAIAHARERETALLNRMSASLLSITSVQAMVDTMAQGISDNLHAGGIIVFFKDGDETTIQSWQTSTNDDCSVHYDILQHARQMLLKRTASHYSASDVITDGYDQRHLPVPCESSSSSGSGVYIPIQTSTTREGVLYVARRKDGNAYTPHEVELLSAMTNLIALFIERQRFEAEACAGQAVREADRMKSTLISSVSHELKTPLAAINATVTNLLAGDITWNAASMTQELGTILEASSRLRERINSLMELSRLQADAWEIDQDWYELAEMMGAAVNTFPKEYRARLAFAIPEDLPPLFLDFHQWTRALHHLLENAFQYAPDASPIQIGACAEDGEIRLWIEDTGPGVPPEESERVFEQFFRGETAKMVPTGTGLGLAITAEVVRGHGGRIWVEQASPQGARFVIVLPNTPRQKGILTQHD